MIPWLAFNLASTFIDSSIRANLHYVFSIQRRTAELVIAPGSLPRPSKGGDDYLVRRLSGYQCHFLILLPIDCIRYRNSKFGAAAGNVCCLDLQSDLGRRTPSASQVASLFARCHFQVSSEWQIVGYQPLFLLRALKVYGAVE